MRSGAIFVVFVYTVIGLFNWVTGLHWLADFSLPLSIAGGLGLAIASTSRTAAIPSTPISTKLETDDAMPSTSSDESENGDDISTTTAAPKASKPLTAPSISFTINKNIRP